MVQIAGEKLIIEINTKCPADNLYNLKESLLGLLSSLNEDSINVENIYNIAQFMKELEPSIEQLKEIYKEK